MSRSADELHRLENDVLELQHKAREAEQGLQDKVSRIQELEAENAECV